MRMIFICYMCKDNFQDNEMTKKMNIVYRLGTKNDFSYRSR